MCSALRFAVETIKITPYIPFSLDEIVKLRSRYRSGEGQVTEGPEGQIWTWAIYNIFGFHHPHTTQDLILQDCSKHCLFTFFPG